MKYNINKGNEIKGHLEIFLVIKLLTRIKGK